MTDTEKYYTPKIEEFHVGFECEFKNNMQDNVWKPAVCDQDLLNIAFTTIEDAEPTDPFDDNFRVKHLDHDDIVGCGWVEQPKADNQVFKGIRQYKKMCDTERDKQVEFTLYLMYSNWVLIAEAGQTRFSGHILNKSELKFQMARLGIKQ